MYLMVWYSVAKYSLKLHIYIAVSSVHNSALGMCTEKSYRKVSISLYYYRSCGQCHMPLQWLIF